MSEIAETAKLPPPVAMLQMIQGFWVSRAIYAVAKLGIADLLKDGPQSIEQLARGTDSDAPSLYRVMRALDSCGVFVESANQHFSLTPIGATLRTDVYGSLRYFAMEELGGNHYTAWEEFLYSVKTGAKAFEHVYGKSKWEYHTEHPEDARIFDEAMTSFSSVVNKEIVSSYDFSSSRVVCDVGGGNGTLLATILKANPKLQGALVDLPYVIPGAQRNLQAQGLAERCQIVAGDFFKCAPPADTYVVKWIIHDWNDEQSVAILRSCREAMADGGRVLLIESLVRPGAETAFTKFLDLNMLVMTGGRERTEDEYRTLFEHAGMQLSRILPTHTPMSVIEAVRA